jgi:fatty acyl-CoA reductase
MMSTQEERCKPKPCEKNGDAIGSNSSKIVPFFANRSIFLTGATGFLGKAIIEKLLRTCPDVKNIYVLIRPKTGYDVTARLAKLLDSPLYDRLKGERPEAILKVVPIEGDIGIPDLGINDCDRSMLAQEVSVVIHSAATIRFNEKLRLAVQVNVGGTQEVVALCKHMKRLVALVHVSTAYANCERETVDEIVYDLPADPYKLLQCLESMEDELLDKITPTLVGRKPNTYTFTKDLAESLLNANVHAHNLPISIVRPSIVAASWREPVPGWVDNMNGATGTFVAYGKGILRTFLCDSTKAVDSVPVDLAVNLILAAAWERAVVVKPGPKDIFIYNCCSREENPILLGELQKVMYDYITAFPFTDVTWPPGTPFQSNPVLNCVEDFFFQYLPALFLDGAAKISGNRPRMLKIYRKLSEASKSLEFFVTHDWTFKTQNTVELRSKMSEEDRDLFCIDIREVVWSEYIRNYFDGIREFVLKEDVSTLVEARKHYKKMKYIQYFTRASCVSALLLTSFFVTLI